MFFLFFGTERFVLMYLQDKWIYYKINIKYKVNFLCVYNAQMFRSKLQCSSSTTLET